MKRFLCFLLVLLFLFPVSGCKNNTIEKPFNFYYLRKNYTYGSDDGVISAEIVDATDFFNLARMLAVYFRGPNDQNLVSPFPAGTYLLNTEKNGDLLTITLSDNFATLTGISLSIACCAIAKTVSEYTDVEAVEIQTVFSLLDGEKSIRVDIDGIVLQDEYVVAETEPTQ